MTRYSSKFSKDEPVYMCNKFWCVGLGQEWACLCEGGGNCLEHLKSRWNRRGERKQKNKKGKQTGSRGGCLKGDTKLERIM